MTETERPLPRPKSLDYISILLACHGIWNVSGGIAPILFELLTDDKEGPNFALVFADPWVVKGILNIVFGWGIQKSRKKWIYYGTFTLALIGLLDFLIGTFISLVILSYLLQPDVQGCYRVSVSFPKRWTGEK